MVAYSVAGGTNGVFVSSNSVRGNKALGFGKSKARLSSEKGTKVTFDDVAGIDEAKQELQEIVDF